MQTLTPSAPLNIAVIGSGISGLSSAWLLGKHHKVTLFEQDSRLGGHTNTVDVMTSAGTVAVDTGFIVFNQRCYPNLIALFKELGVVYQGTDMSFGVSLDKGRLEYSGSNSISTLFAQKRNLFRPRFWGMIRDLLRFYKQSAAWLHSLPDDMSLGELLEREKFGPGFCQDHLLPMGAAIWSTPVEKFMAYPAKTFLRFCDNHGLLQVNERPQWQTVIGGSREYVKRIQQTFTGDIRLNCKVAKVRRFHDHVIITNNNGENHRFDHVVMAGHADQSLAMLDDANTDEKRLLGAFAYEQNDAVLHRDEKLMPVLGEVWSSWNYLADREQEGSKVSVSYWMNSLQHLPCHEQLIVTLNPLRTPRKHLVYEQFSYQHPVFDDAALNAQKHLWSLQGKQRTWFCGSYFGYGFHEDGIQSGLAVAEQLGGVSRPWNTEQASDRIHVHAASTLTAAA
ncbi:NAD(P)/FAD-dependent oxidoreductase [Zhongshania sp.]|jgi:predicted NAD/FAD-binding protein|uniref:NAD(P)/FAD-dependent oxidoreductase n=1 Tax=Zhongshania sp. TaxID=1971902 RepID=UPI001B71F496|nr:FAD-dependent oxidoreductase [Zhongshania sp.]MBQ0794789.1 FAD-dependent oxidoreductase [Zhongshania sp.]